jgi:pimeloyl-ACP methyl ester carboxylesterase
MARPKVIFVCLALALIIVQSSLASGETEMVVLLHGLGRTNRAMRPLEDRLSAAGFLVHSISYPSMRLSLAKLTAFIEHELATCCNTASRLHFVTHSLGGILVRAYLADNHPSHMGRVVMIAPPNRGSELSDLIRRSCLLRAVLGPIAPQLGTEDDSFPNRLPPPWFDLGIIAGIDSFNPVGGLLVPNPSDGTVSVASTQLTGMADFVTVRESHTFIMRSQEVADYVIRFLHTGRFRSAEEKTQVEPQ